MQRAAGFVVAIMGVAACNGGGGSGADASIPAIEDGAAKASGPFSESCSAGGPVGKFARTLTVNNGAELEGVVLGAEGVIQATSGGR
jgi:hypothetical protein